MENEILEAEKLIAVFMGYVHIKDNVLYDTCDDTSFKHYTYETVYSKTPIYTDSEDYLEEVKNPDYGNKVNPHWNPDLETLNWASVNDHFIKPNYHTSWNAQIPVWSKIAKLIKKIADDGNEFDYKMYMGLIGRYENAVFNNIPMEGFVVITDAIYFYNTQNQVR